MLYAYRTTPRRSISKTLFSMTFWAEVVIPVEVGLSSMRVACFSLYNNNAYMTEQLDLLEENQEMAKIRLADYQQKLVQRNDRKVKPREFIAGDLVLRRVVGNMKDQSSRKLAPN